MTIEVQRWEDKFEIKPGVWVYVPSVEARKVGGKILQAVRNKWIPPLYFYHLRTGGHLKAARLHLKSDFFAVVDIPNDNDTLFLTIADKGILNNFFSQRAVVVSPVI